VLPAAERGRAQFDYQEERKKPGIMTRLALLMPIEKTPETHGPHSSPAWGAAGTRAFWWV